MPENSGSRPNIFPIPGINSNVLKEGTIFHVQTEVITSKKIILTQIFHRGTIIYSDFVSFKKHYEELINSDPRKLKRGIVTLVKMLHQKSMNYLKNLAGNQNEYNLKKIFMDWLKKTYLSMKNDYDEMDFSIYFYDEKSHSLTPISGPGRDTDHPVNLIKTATIFVQKASNTFNKRPFLFSLETRDTRLFFVLPRHNTGGIFNFGRNFSFGLAKLEIKRYLSILENLLQKEGYNKHHIS